MKRFHAAEIRRFLICLDGKLTGPFEMIMIGGSAAALAYGTGAGTKDIDTWNADVLSIEGAISAARKESGLDIPVEHAGVADAPYNFEERLEVVGLPGVRRLAILVPEKHDLVLMKTFRCNDSDLETADRILASRGLDADVLMTRWSTETDHIIGDSRRLDLNFLALMERLFGGELLVEAERMIRSRSQQQRST